MSTRASRRPNILLITSDQQHWQTLGSNNPRIRTPALDRLCETGVRFDRGYCPNPTCTPTRASIITGMYRSTRADNAPRRRGVGASVLRPSRVRLDRQRLAMPGVSSAHD